MRRLGRVLVLLAATAAWAGDTVVLKFRLVDDYLILVPGSIGSIQGLTFLLDTGASRTLIDVRLADRLGLARRTAEVFMLGQRQTASRVDVADLRFGPISAVSLSPFAVDLESFARRVGTRIDAVVGLDVLRDHSFAISYRRHRLEFGVIEPHGPAVAFDPGSPYLVVTAQVSGQPTRLLVDTGINQLSVFAAQLPRELRQHQLLTAIGASAAGSVRAAYLRDVEVRFADWRMPNMLLFVVPDAADFLEYDGFLGVCALGAERVYFDFDHGQLRLEY
jgi:predicted aspartyl protease